MQYGKHLLIEVIIDNKDIKHLCNNIFIKKLFVKIIKAVGMKAVSPIFNYQFPKRYKKQKTGITSFCVLAESHIAIHTWPENSYFSLDLFSCKNFNEKKAITVIKKAFKIQKLYFKTIKRGLRINF